ncbi:MAG TPA: hypothetical protein PLK13_12700 [Xanthobacteraceae bacterium]|jgi:predicted phage tail protein|uniref:hypothetical protein n=1 Tax=Roseixanthobacter finlandensis TaxID=3119922 RepID=UPI000BDBB2A9|nr:MAG: hypothetical protein B7Y61_11020 [Rhizobiales bacterium 35-66-30]OZB06234.1 MAG: hypothetical protein B7X67_10650 [Rhizobiales bacterium 39-66-18]HQS09674.1 hypothetical protein [Xanthobacteraceae bacterium]
MTTLSAYLASLETAAAAAEQAEADFRRETEARAAALAYARAHAYRRSNLVATLATLAEGAETPELAVAAVQAHLRARLGWDDMSDARDAVLTRFAPVALALFSAAHPVADEDPAKTPEGAAPDPAGALAAFEDWYAETRESPFWYLFEHYIPETPRVDY